MSEFKMPSLGADMDAGTLALWKVKPGDKFKRGDILAEVETAKGVIEIEVFEDGVITEILVPVGVPVPVGEVLARIGAEGDPIVQAAPKAAEVQAPPAAVAPPPPAPAAPAPAPVAAAIGGDRLKISPLAAKVAMELKVDINQIKGSGPGGAITRTDVEKAAQAQKAAPPAPAPVAPTPVAPAPVAPPAPVAAAPAPAAPPAEGKKMDFQTAMRQAIAAAMSKSNREIPHYYLETHIDMSHALRWLEGPDRCTRVERLLD